MTDFLDSFMQQVAQTVAAQQQNPPTLPVNPTQNFPVRATPNDLFLLNEGLRNSPLTPPVPASAMASQLAQPVAPAGATAVQQAIGQQAAPRMAPSLTTPNPALYANAAARPVAAAASTAPSAVSTVASVADDVALGAADDAAAVGLGGRIRSAFPALSGASIGRGSLLKGGAAAIGGLVASGWLDSQNFGGENSNLDQALKGGALGAGVGAGAAMVLGLGAGPVGWAALGGAALFSIGNAIMGDNDTTLEKMDKKVAMANDTINELINNPAFGIDADTASQIRLQVAATTEFYKNNEDMAGLESYLAGLAQTVPSFLMEGASRNQAQQQKMQMQAAFGPVYSRMVDRSTTAAKQAFDIQMEAANAIRDPQTSAAMKSAAAQQYTAQMDTMAAYAQQIAAAPQNLKPSEQMVVDNTSALMQQAMGMGLGQ